MSIHNFKAFKIQDRFYMDLIIFFSSQCKSSFPSHNIKSSWVLKHKIVPHKKCIGFLWWFIEHKKHTNIWYQVSTLLLQEGERRHFTLFIVPWKKFFLSYKVWNQLWNKKRYSIRYLDSLSWKNLSWDSLSWDSLSWDSLSSRTVYPQGQFILRQFVLRQFILKDSLSSGTVYPQIVCPQKVYP